MTDMTKRTLGRSGISIAPLALGGNVFGWTIDEKVSFQVLDAFVDFGFDLVDTANMYSAWVPGHKGGESETIIGNWFTATGKRDKVVLATKVGMPMGDGSKGLKRDYILRSLEDSLKRLQTDHVDLYQSHKDDPETPLEETLSAYDALIKQGKVRAIGASNYDAARLKQALQTSEEKGLPSYVSLQPEYNLYERKGFEEALEPLCVEKGIGVISYYSLASGFLTGKYRSRNDLGQRPRRRDRHEVSQRARLSHSRRTRRGVGGPSHRPGGNRPRLAHRAKERHGPYRECDECRAAFADRQSCRGFVD